MNPSITGTEVNLTTDILILGSGSGLAAAVAAKEAGVKDITILEKQALPGGNTRMAMGLFACESPLQKRLNVNISQDICFKKYVEWAHWSRIDPRVVRAYINKTGDTIRWLEEKGVEFELAPTFPNGLRIGHTPVVRGSVQKVLLKQAEESGVKILLKTSARQIIRGANGNITGALVVRDGQEFQIEAKSIILATGGFGHNRELLKKYCPDYYDEMPIENWPNHMGEGLIMAQAIGAITAESIPIYHRGPVYPGCAPGGVLFNAIKHPISIWVNKHGRRFIDESAGFWAWESGNAILAQPGKVMYTLFDDAVKQDIQTKGLTGGSNSGADKGFADLGIALQNEIGSGGVKIAGSWDEIATFIGAKPEILKAEIDDYNSFCRSGHDEVFAKDRRYLSPLQKAPYYAIKCYSTCGETLGGIKVTERMEMVDIEGNPILGAYVSGVLADGWEMQTYCCDIPGTAFGFAVNSGRIAGENAAKYILKN
jgi:fumarate reductase flavoprotein subunit